MPNLIAHLFPVVRVRRRARARFLLPVEWARLRTVLEQEPLNVRVYFYLLVLEGSRMSEARLMQWSHLDLGAALWRKPMTKNGTPQILPLSEASCQLLDSLPRDHRYVFHGNPAHTGTKDGPWCRTSVFFYWQRIRTAAHLEDIQIRDLRRTLASWMAMNGENLMIIKEILHHRSIVTTQTYARVDHASQRAALSRHAKRILT